MADVELNSIGNGDGNNYLLRDNTKIPLAGSNQISGSLIPATDNAYNLGDSTYGFKDIYTNKIYLKDSTIFKLVDDNFICIGGSTDQANGANLVLNGKNRSTSTGEFKLEARDGTYTRQLIGKPGGTLSWNGDIIPSTDGTYNLGNSNYFFKNTYSKVMYVETLMSSDNTCGIVFGTDSSSIKQFRPRGADNNAIILGTSFARWKEIWCTQSSINSSSDERQKQQIKPIDNDLLDAWENVNPIQFKWNDAVAKKGDNARVHTGYIAQNIQQALTENGVNPNDYGLFLYDEWGEEQEEKDEQGNIVRPYRPSGNAYGLRYTEALIVECAYLRKKNKDLQEQLNALSERLEKLENR